MSRTVAMSKDSYMNYLYLCKSKEEKKELRIAENIRLRNKGLTHKQNTYQRSDGLTKPIDSKCQFCTYYGDEWAGRRHWNMDKCLVEQTHILAFADSLKTRHEKIIADEVKEYIDKRKSAEEDSVEEDSAESEDVEDEALEEKNGNYEALKKEYDSLQTNYSHLRGTFADLAGIFIQYTTLADPRVNGFKGRLVKKLRSLILEAKEKA
jgi:hypothetical protein